jgi:Zn-dependent protease/predicted transcriptional regulator
MKWSLYLGKISGIKIFIHWTFLILIGWIFLMHAQAGNDLSEGLWGVIFILFLFACVVLHELGHALTAKRFKIVTRDITLYPIGGIASMESLPEKPGQELLVALAGPAVNVVIAAGLWIYMQSADLMPDLSKLKSADEIENVPFVFNLFAANVVVVVFNLIPAFPMDGGRVLRAILAFKMDRTKATRIAATIGQFMAMIFVFFGFFFNFWLVFIGLFVFLGASAEAKAEETKAGLKGVKVSDVLMSRYSVLKPGEPLSNAVSLLLDSQERSFVIEENGEVKGMLSRKEIISGLTEFGKNASVENAMKTDFPHLKTSDLLNDVMERFETKEYSLMPVFKENKLAGVLDLENITEYLMVQNAIKSS